MIRVVLVDDSPSVRAVLRRFFARTPDIEVVAEAEDGARAVEAVLAAEPHVVVMDLQMPVMDGYDAIERIMAVRPTPIVVLSSRANRNQMRDRVRGDAPRRPRGAAQTGGHGELAAARRDASSAVRAAARPVRVAEAREVGPADIGVGGPRRAGRRPQARARARRSISSRSAPRPAARRRSASSSRRCRPRTRRSRCSSCSTSPRASRRASPTGSPRTSSSTCAWRRTASNRHDRAPSGWRRAAPICSSVPAASSTSTPHAPLGRGHRPSVDELFLSCAESCPHQVAAVLLSGMGERRREGLLAVRRAGGLTMVQDEASSVVFGMPRAALERDAADVSLPPARRSRR